MFRNYHLDKKESDAVSLQRASHVGVLVPCLNLGHSDTCFMLLHRTNTNTSLTHRITTYAELNLFHAHTVCSGMMGW